MSILTMHLSAYPDTRQQSSQVLFTQISNRLLDITPPCTPSDSQCGNTGLGLHISTSNVGINNNSNNNSSSAICTTAATTRGRLSNALYGGIPTTNIGITTTSAAVATTDVDIDAGKQPRT